MSLDTLKRDVSTLAREVRGVRQTLRRFVSHDDIVKGSDVGDLTTYPLVHSLDTFVGVGGVTLSWDHNHALTGPFYWEVHRSTDGVAYDKVATVYATTYTDKPTLETAGGAALDTTFWYKIRIHTASGEGWTTAAQVVVPAILADDIAAAGVSDVNIAGMDGAKLFAASVTADRIDVNDLAADSAFISRLVAESAFITSIQAIDLAAEAGTIGGWIINSSLLKSAPSGARIELNKSKNRISIFDATNEVVAQGYVYELPIYGGSGTATSATPTTLTDTSNEWTSNRFAGVAYVEIESGTGAGQRRNVISNTADTLTVATWDTTPDATSVYRLYHGPDVYMPGWAREGDKMVFDGDAEFVGGNFIMGGNASLLAQDAAGDTYMRIGKYGGVAGVTFFEDFSATHIPQIRAYDGSQGTGFYLGVLSAGSLNNWLRITERGYIASVTDGAGSVSTLTVANDNDATPGIRLQNISADGSAITSIKMLPSSEEITLMVQEIGGDSSQASISVQQNAIQHYIPDEAAAVWRVALNGGTALLSVDNDGVVTQSNGDNSYTHYGPNASWGGELYVGATPDKSGTQKAQVISTDGNLHLDSADGKTLYVNHYSGGRLILQGCEIGGPIGDYGSLQIKTAQGGWYGLTLGNYNVVMSNDTAVGFFNDHENEWILFGNRNGSVHLYYNNVEKLRTDTYGILTYGRVNVTQYFYSDYNSTTTPIVLGSNAHYTKRMDAEGFTNFPSIVTTRCTNLLRRVDASRTWTKSYLKGTGVYADTGGAGW